MSPAPLPFRRLLVAGASARWAAQSLRPAAPWLAAADRFGDRDTRAAVDQFDLLADWDDLRHVVPSCRPDALIPLGGLENHPALLTELARQTEVLGTPPATLAAALDPHCLQQVFIESFPAVRFPADPPPGGSRSRWLWKPIRSGGGLGIREAPLWDCHQPARGDGYYQQRLAGPTWGATFLASPAGIRLLGVCRQLNGPPFTTDPFLYAGSIGPLPIAPHRAEEIRQLATRWCDAYPVKGLFGIDFMGLDDPDAPLQVVDLNLRPPASAELIEAAWGEPVSLLAEHVRASCPPVPNIAWEEALAIDSRSWGPLDTRPRQVWGKAVWYVPPGLSGRFPEGWEDRAATAGNPFELADCPLAGTKLASGQPGFTIQLSRPSPAAVLTALTAARETLEGRFSGWLGPSPAT